jgi:hypothetical protein
VHLRSTGCTSWVEAEPTAFAPPVGATPARATPRSPERKLLGTAAVVDGSYTDRGWPPDGPMSAGNVSKLLTIKCFSRKNLALTSKYREKKGARGRSGAGLAAFHSVSRGGGSFQRGRRPSQHTQMRGSTRAAIAQLQG